MRATREVVCVECFRDRRLREWILETGKRVDLCPWCGTTGCSSLNIAALGGVFREAFKALYVETDSSGSDPADLLQADWQIFSEGIETADSLLMHDLGQAILHAGLHPKDDVDEPDYSGYFKPSSEWLLDDWHERIDDLLGRDTHAPTGEALPDPLGYALEWFGEPIAAGTSFYRARIYDRRHRVERFELEELGAPSPEDAPAGRANRRGEPVLYLASDPDTALAEVRAWRGCAVAVGTLCVTRDLEMVDLRAFNRPRSPFFDEEVGWRLQLASLFDGFARELSIPTLPGEQEVLYEASQHLCDMIKAEGYDAVAYPSALGPGFNLVCFDPEAAAPTDRRDMRTLGVGFDTRELHDGEPQYDNTPYNHLLPNQP